MQAWEIQFQVGDGSGNRSWTRTVIADDNGRPDWDVADSRDDADLLSVIRAVPAALYNTLFLGSSETTGTIRVTELACPDLSHNVRPTLLTLRHDPIRERECGYVPGSRMDRFGVITYLGSPG